MATLEFSDSYIMRSIIIVLLILYCKLSFGQSNSHYLNVSYGFGKSNIERHTVLKERYESLPANSLKLTYQFGFSKKFSISSGVVFEQRGGQFTSFEREIIGEKPLLMLGDTILRNNKNKFAYLSIPLILKYNLHAKKLTINVKSGGYCSFLVQQLWNFDNSDKITLIEGYILQFDYSTIDYGLIIGFGFDYQLSKNMSLILDYQFQKGLMDVFSDGDIKGYHIRNAVEIGLNIRIGKGV